MTEKPLRLLYETDRANILESIRDKGLVISGNIGSGKTVLAQALALELKKFETETKGSGNHRTVNLGIFDTIGLDWRNYFFAFYDRLLDENKIRNNMTAKTLTSESLKYLACDIETVVTFLDIPETEKRRHILTKILFDCYMEQREKRLKGKYTENYIFIMEEAQTIFSTYAIRGNFLETYFSTCRNYDISNIAIVQRMTEISTKLREKIPNFAFGFTRGSNNLRQIKEVTDKPTSEEVKTLKTGKDSEFLLFIDADSYKIHASFEEGITLKDVSA